MLEVGNLAKMWIWYGIDSSNLGVLKFLVVEVKISTQALSNHGLTNHAHNKV